MKRYGNADVRLVFLFGDIDSSETVPVLFSLTRSHIYEYLNRDHWSDSFRNDTNFGLIHGYYGKPDDVINGSEKIGAKCNEVYRDFKTGDVAIVSFATGEVERLNIADMNVMEKIVFKMFFPDAPMTEDKLVLAQAIVKNFRENYETCNKLVKKGFFTEDDLSGDRIVRVIQNVYSRGIEQAMTKYVKSHKGDIHVRSTIVATISDAYELVPFLLTTHLEEKGIEVIFAPTRSGDEKWKILKPLSKLNSHYYDCDPFGDDYKSSRFGGFVAVACLQEGIGHFDKYGCFYVLEQDIDSVCKIAKKVYEGKYTFKFTNSGDDILIKDNDEIVVNLNHLPIIRKRTVEEKENAGVHNPSQT